MSAPTSPGLPSRSVSFPEASVPLPQPEDAAEPASHPVRRPMVRDGQVLCAADLNAAHEYLVNLRRWHLTGAHTWGIVSGLALVGDTAAGGDITIQPGLAVDGYGRELRVPMALRIPAVRLGSLADALQADRLALCLVSDPPAAPDAGRDGSVPRGSRCPDAVRIWVTAATGQRGLSDPHCGQLPAPEPANGTGAVRGCRRQAASGALPAWPICLGEVERRQGQPFSVTAEGCACRCYSQLMGTQLVAPSGAVEVRLEEGADVGLPRFALLVRSSDTSLPQERMSVSAQGKAIVSGDLVSQGNLIIPSPSVQAGRPATEGALRFASAISAPDAPAPWRLYRTRVSVAGQAREELRAELPARTVASSRLTIRPRGPSAHGTPLTIDAAGVVTVGGTLKVDGTLYLKVETT